jgi:flagellar biosynthesis GTPase FlhF
VVEKTNGDIGLAPSNYVESCDKPTTTKTPASPVETTKETLTACEPKWAIALFSFTPESSEETSLDDHEQVLITDYISNKDWWTIEHKDGTSGIVPSSYVKFQDEYEAELRAEQEQEEKKRAALQKQEQEQRDKERQREMAEHNRIKEQEEKERARQAEAERRRKMQEEAKQREIDAKKQASVKD